MLSPQALGHHPTYGPEPVAQFPNCWFGIRSDTSEAAAVIPAQDRPASRLHQTLSERVS